MLNSCCMICSLMGPSEVARNWSKSLSLWSRDRWRLLRHASLAIPKVDKKLAMLMFSRDMYSSFTKSFCWTVAGGPLLYPGLAMLEKAWGTTCGVCANLLSTTLYQLPLCGGMLGNFPISKVLDVLGLTRSSCALWRRDRSPLGVLFPVVVGEDHVLRPNPAYSPLQPLGRG